MVAVVAGVVVVVSRAVVAAQRRKTFKENVNVGAKKLEICGRHNDLR